MNRPIFLRLIVLLVVALLAQGCVGFGAYSFASIEARVVDEETGQPIEGAIVVANWQLEEATFHLTIKRDSLEIQETVTDRDGRFKLAGFTKVNATPYFLKSRAPQIIIFKPNYRFYYYSAAYPMGEKAAGMSGIPQPDISGSTVKLKSFGSNREDYEDRFIGVGVDLDFAYSITGGATDKCAWTKAPMIIAAMEKERRNLVGARQLSLPAIDRLLSRDCPNVPAALKELGK